MGGSQDLSLRVLLQAVDSGFSSVIHGLGNVLGGLSGPAGMAAAGLLAIGSAAIGIGVQAVQAASQFQASMNMVQSLTGASSQQMAQYDSQLKQLAMNAGVAPNALAQGLYQVISAGYQGAQAMNILTLATEDSKIGMTDAKTTSEALTNVLANFTWQTKDANRVNGEMLETVTLGKATFQQYASNITKAATVSQQYKISLETMSAAWATMTANGISAGKASTDYQQVVGLMYGKVGTLTKSLEKNGIAFNEAQFNSDSFGQKILYLQQLLDEASKKHVQLTGVTLQAAQAITVISGHYKTYQNDLSQLSNKQAMAQKTQQAWAITQSGFQQTLSRLGATLQVVLIDIGQQLLPVLTQMAQSVLPIITNIGTWITQSGIITTSLNLLGTGIKNTVGFVTGLVNGISSIVTWFKNCQVASLALLIPLSMIGAVLVNMAVSAIVSFIASLPALIGGFIAWAAAAWTAAAGVIAATWPVLAIGAAIGLLIGIIILLWTHWSQVTAWLQNAWQTFTSWIMNSLKLQAAIWGTIWNGIVNGLKSAWNWIVTVIQDSLKTIVDAFTAPFRAIGALFSWLYNHNYYFKMLVDRIHAIIFMALVVIQAKWQQFVGWLTGIWNSLVGFATTAYNNLKNAIMSVVLAIGNWELNQWNKATKWLTDKWNSFAGLAQKAWQMVSGVFSSIWNTYISKPLSNLWNSISGWFGNLATNAFNWGKNMITGFLNGVKNMFGSVGQTMGNLMSNVSKFLGFHSPAQQGEGQHIIEWGTNMVRGFNSGVIAAIPTLQASVSMAVKTGLQPMSPPALASAIPYGRPPVSNNSYNAIAGGNHYGNYVFNIPGSSNPDAVANAVMKKLNQQYRRSGTMGNLSSGGRSS